MKQNDVILQSVTRVAVVIILTFSIYLFMNGHHHPGGGFIGGLSTAAAIVLLYLSFGIEKVRENIRMDFKKLAAIGVLIAVGTGMTAVVFGKPFLTQAFDYFNLPIFGETELASALIFDTGVALAVIGTAVNIILSISEDR
ncbi:multisubunit sodium/proton antiporter MrpB subunit [Fontibacillus phaseoli]|uniref:Multisubunit sodium/proton antiporter MrpB subunit n=1 Tax=Fontibacillus phaseoli TaxID=1416533 RepID=A0A369BDG0_9BACL|nr:Na(+)/H(+) antiporter subunit B [Fontibacillus phaseoli]RCX18638.1 multisubunit sodium/proton antiporter MrpB subunit [Fontibacillus phaseoli]